MKQIAVIDDDQYISDMLYKLLTREGYSVIRAYSGTEALMLLSSHTPDLILLDLMLPGLTGEEILPKIKNIPVIVVSAKVDTNDKVRLLLDGAADYVTKPFDTKELLARIIAALRKSQPNTSSVLSFRELTLDTDTHLVCVNEKTVKLTKTEFAILRQLMQSPSQVITKSQILDLISTDTPDCMESSLKVHISNLRKKLREINGRDYIEAVWGIGFKMQEE
ncbi:MAG: response regulator transcription factor [Oscillospiraceae bacterium]|nr:response regulator transcription factor [Oscillospiraceae bacterium]